MGERGVGSVDIGYGLETSVIRVSNPCLFQQLKMRGTWSSPIYDAQTGTWQTQKTSASG